jgi:hypothetical protein
MEERFIQQKLRVGLQRKKINPKQEKRFLCRWNTVLAVEFLATA